MIRDYLLLLSWLCAVQGKIGKYPDGDACVSAPFETFSFSKDDSSSVTFEKKEKLL